MFLSFALSFALSASSTFAVTGENAFVSAATTPPTEEARKRSFEERLFDGCLCAASAPCVVASLPAAAVTFFLYGGAGCCAWSALTIMDLEKNGAAKKEAAKKEDGQHGDEARNKSSADVLERDMPQSEVQRRSDSFQY